MKCPYCHREISVGLRCPYCHNVVPYYSRYDTTTVPVRKDKTVLYSSRAEEQIPADSAYAYAGNGDSGYSYAQDGFAANDTSSQNASPDVLRVLMAMGVLIIGLQVIILMLLIALLG